MTDNRHPWEKRVEAIARMVCEEMIQDLRNESHERLACYPAAPSILDKEAPPITERKGRKEKRLWGKIGTTTDAVLANLFDQEARQRGISTGRLMDEILWRHYNKPTLSYELPDEEYDRLKSMVESKRNKKEPGS